MRGSLLCLLTLASLPLALALAGQTLDPKQTEADENKLQSVNLQTDGPALVAFLKSRTLTDEDRERIDLLIAQLGASSFKVREHATSELIAKGPAVLELLRAGLAHPDLEVQRRCESCIEKIKERNAPEVAAAAVRLIGVRQPDGTVDALLGFAPFVDSDAVTEEIRAVLPKVAVRDGKLDNALLAALKDKLPARRAMAGEALVRAGAYDKHKDAVAPLLRDADVKVRTRVATALVVARHKEAVPSLIDLLSEVSQSDAWQIENILYSLAEGKSPPTVSLGTDKVAREKYQATWHKWWKDHAAGVDLAVLSKTPQLLGRTTLVLLDRSQVVEVAADDKVIWQIDKLDFPLDVQVLGNDRVLVAEYQGNRVTERNLKGDVVWERAFEGPQMAQRLPNGNTFIGSKFELLEIDPAGKQVFIYHIRGGGDGVMKCSKLPGGDIVYLQQVGPVDGRVVYLSAAGKELGSFRVQLGKPLYGGRINALPNGNVLVPHHEENKVVEYDRTGKVVWQLKIDQPIAATRLPNGNTLVTSMNQNRAVEFDRDGNEVWQYRQTTRVTRAVRR